MSIQLLHQTSGTGASISYNCPAGSKRVMVVTASAKADLSGLTPTFNGVSFTNQISSFAGDDLGWYAGSAICTLVNPDVGTYTLNFGGTVNYSVSVWSGVSQQIPVLSTSSNFKATLPASEYWGTASLTMQYTATTGSVKISCYGVNWNGEYWIYDTVDAYHTKMGEYAAYGLDSSKYITWYRANSYWFSGSPRMTVVGLYLKEDPSFSVNDSLITGDSADAIKGLLIKVQDFLNSSEVYNQIKNVIISVSDSLNFIERGWLGSISNIKNTFKNIISSIKNKDKSE